MPMFNYNNVDNIQICMDVPFVDHPYLIGPRGRKCQHLMDRYRSLIHFPDSNRRQNGPKLNNVVIHGSSKNAEELRFQIRSRTPIRLAVLLQAVPDPAALCSKIEVAIVDRSLPIRFNYTENFSNAMLKTEWRNEEVLIKFCDEFFPRDAVAATAYAGLDYPTAGGDGESVLAASLFTMALTVLPVLNPWNIDVSHRLIDHIYQATGASVFYPPKEMFADQPPSYFIKAGDVTSVIQAGKYLLGLTMFQVSFIVPNNVQLNLQETLNWQRDLLVHTAVEPVFSNPNNNDNGGGGGGVKGEFLHNRAILRSFECCLNSVYFVRSLLLGFKKTVQSSHYSFMTDVKRMIPYSIFSEGQLYFPLYAIDDNRSFDFSTTGTEFFRKFYGGPYSLQAARERKERERSSYGFYGGLNVAATNPNAIGAGHNAIATDYYAMAGVPAMAPSNAWNTAAAVGSHINYYNQHNVSVEDSNGSYGFYDANNSNAMTNGFYDANNSNAMTNGFYDASNNNAMTNYATMMSGDCQPDVGYGFYGGLNAAAANLNAIGAGHDAMTTDYYGMAGVPAMAPSNAWNTAAAVGSHINYYNQHNVSVEDSNGSCFYDANNNNVNGATDYYATMMSGDCQPDLSVIDGPIYKDTAVAVGAAPSSKRKSASF